MCESHMKRAVDRRTFENQGNHELVKTDLNKLKMAYNGANFDLGCNLFVDKWMPIEPGVTNYIVDT